MAETYSTRPSQLLGLPSSDDWHAYCLDEAVYVLTRGHDARDQQWEDKFREDAGDGGDLYGKIMADPRTGKSPSAQDMAMLPSVGPDDPG